MSNNTIYARVNLIDNVYIAHPAISRAISGIEECLEYSKTSAEPVNALLVGEPGTGKTTVCNAITHKHPPRLEERDGYLTKIVPTFNASIPSGGTVRGVAVSLLYSLKAPHPNRGNKIDLTLRLGQQLKTCQTKLILLDEFQHLLGNYGSSKGAQFNEVRDWVKTIINEFKVPIILVGMPDCESLIEDYPQLARRFERRFTLSNLKFGSKDKGEFRKFLENASKAVKQCCQLKALPDFRVRADALAMYAATNGNPADTLKLLKEATKYCLLDDREVVTTDDLANAFEYLKISNSLVKRTNPFRLNENELNNRLSKALRNY